MNGEEKHKTCIFRSADVVSKTIQRCSCQGGNYQIHGHFCNKKQLMDVKPSDCETCTEYQHK